jgi:hypothetical protein
MQFQPGDRVTVSRPNRDNLAHHGKTGTVVDDGSKSGGLIAVKGIEGRVREAVGGYIGFYAEELTKA